MQKSELIRFINKYSLGTEIKSPKWESSGTSLSTRVITGDKSVAQANDGITILLFFK